ncbi:CHRD domain-containing protein [Enhydrobacter aerosaccus]|uniref:CHRD domain-containing protein n=1 Tax=Enhydrobacter aerosaccus TaxID=225324 RepID=A0A1T4THL3_9HYPH|nr:CHRD domain-containing protein [Enhydrobacter aerosaccus]SKA39917.1 CHRD domain-containing protein [Enhydrobacter aerosaccus]
MAKKILRACLLLATLTGLAGCMSYFSDPVGSNIDLGSTLSGAQEVPPTDSKAGGYLTALYSTSTHIFKWRLVVNALSSPIRRAEFHGPDALGQDAALVELYAPFDGTTHAGSATLTPQQAADLLAGRWYIDIKTEKFPDGEIRGLVKRTSGRQKE